MISTMVRLSWARSLGTAATPGLVSCCAAAATAALASAALPGSVWTPFAGGLNLLLLLGSIGMRITHTQTNNSPDQIVLQVQVWVSFFLLVRCGFKFSFCKVLSVGLLSSGRSEEKRVRLKLQKVFKLHTHNAEIHNTESFRIPTGTHEIRLFKKKKLVRLRKSFAVKT